MNPWFRRVFFWLLTVTFFITTPVIVLFLIGYRYSFERGVFIYTGSVSIQANPGQNLDIRIDGAPVSSESNRINRSYHIEGISPGKHSLSVSAPGFTAWSKEITVRSGIATEFWNVLLARDQYGQKMLPLPEGSLAFFPSPNADTVALLSERNGETLITVLDRTNGNRRQIFSTTEFLPGKSVPEEIVRWSPRNNTLLLTSLISKETGEEHTFLIHTDTLAETDLKDIVRVPNPREAQWNPNADTILFLSENTLLSVPIDASLQETSLSQNTETYDIVGNTILSLEPKTGILYQIPIGNPSQKEQLTTAPPEGFFGDYETPYSLIAYDKTRIALIRRDSGDLFLWKSGEKDTWFEKLSGDAKGLQFSDDGKKLLYWTDWEIFTIFTRKWEVQPVREENDRLDVGRFSNTIDHVQWTKDYEHILFSSGREIKTIELDDRGGRNTLTLLTLPNSPLQLSSIGSHNELLFLLPNEGAENLSTLSSITFPEPVGLFGFGG